VMAFTYGPGAERSGDESEGLWIFPACSHRILTPRRV